MAICTGFPIRRPPAIAFFGHRGIVAAPDRRDFHKARTPLWLLRYARPR
jgi:hypothetical protein